MEKAYLATLIAIMYVEIKLPLPSRNGRRDMNVCMRATFKCTWDEMIARLEHNMSTISAAHTGWTVAKESVGLYGDVLWRAVSSRDSLYIKHQMVPSHSSRQQTADSRPQPQPQPQATGHTPSASAAAGVILNV